MFVGVLLLLAVLAPAHAGRPLWRWISTDQGLQSQHIDALAQGPQDVLWIGTATGVHRYDGERAEVWGGGQIRSRVKAVAPLTAELALARTETSDLLRVSRETSAPLDLPDGAGPAWDVASDGPGSAVVLLGDDLWRTDGWTWTLVREDAVEGRSFGRVRPLGDGRFITADHRAFYLLDADGRRELAPVHNVPVDAVQMRDGTFWVLDSLGHTTHVRADGTVLNTWDADGRGMGLAPRGDDLWAAYDGILIRHRDGERRIWTTTDAGFVSGGPLLADREGSLWLGTFHGVGHLAEPEAQRWTEHDGLPSEHSRWLHLGDGHLYVSSWVDVGRIDLRDPSAERVPMESRGQVCTDGSGLVWGLEGVGGDLHFRAIDVDTLAVRGSWPVQGTRHWLDGCGSGAEEVWYAVAGRIYRAVSGELAAPERVAELPVPAGDRGGAQRVIEDDRGTLWVAAGPSVCATRAAALRTGAPTWRCSRIPEAAFVHDLEPMPSGALWATTDTHGLWVLPADEDVWERIPGADDLPGRRLLGLGRSPRGGVWLGGAGTLLRVREAPGSPSGWVVEERLGGWLGPMIGDVVDIVELDDGTVWLAHEAGVTQVPAEARVQPTRAPIVNLVEVRVDGRRVEGSTVALPATDSRVYARFVAASYRAPGLLRYRRRVDAGPWEATSDDAVFDVTGLEPGAHRLEVSASLDGVHWSEPPGSLAVRVPWPWYGRLDVWLVVGLVLAVLVAALWRLRLELALQLERQRTLIAMDLHDEVGAGIGAVGMLGGLLDRGELTGDAPREVGAEIERTTVDLDESLRAIVWSLRPRSDRVGALADFLRDRAQRVLAAIDRRGGLDLDLPGSDAPAQLDLHVLRAVQRTALEAMHNAARHADAEHVTVRLGPTTGGRWELVVADDGRGFDLPAELGDDGPADGGFGLAGMRHRAAEIDARLELHAAPGDGTRVRLEFRPRPGLWRRIRALFLDRRSR